MKCLALTALVVTSLALAACERQAAREASPRLGRRELLSLILQAAPLPPLLFAAPGTGSARCGERESKERRTQGRPGNNGKEGTGRTSGPCRLHRSP